MTCISVRYHEEFTANSGSRQYLMINAISARCSYTSIEHNPQYFRRLAIDLLLGYLRAWWLEMP